VLRGDVSARAAPRHSGTSSTASGTALLSKPTSSSEVSRSRSPTSTSARAASFRPEAEIAGETTRVLVEQVGAVDAQRLGELSGHLTREEMWGSTKRSSPSWACDDQFSSPYRHLLLFLPPAAYNGLTGPCNTEQMSALLSVRYASDREQAAWAELFRHFMDDGVDPFEVRRRVGAAEVAGLEVLGPHR